MIPTMPLVFQSELIIIILLFLVTVRPFIRGLRGFGAIVVLSPLTLVLCTLHIVSHGISIIILLLTILAVFIFIINLLHLGRFLGGITVYYYTVFFRILSIMVLALLMGTAYFSWLFKPSQEISIDKNKIIQVEKKIEHFKGNTITGFIPKNRYLDISSTLIYITYPLNMTSEQIQNGAIFLYLPDVFASVEESFATIKSIAERGNIVVSADFFGNQNNYIDSRFNNRFVRSFYLRTMNYFDKDFAKNHEKNWEETKTREIHALFKLLPLVQNETFVQALEKKCPLILTADGKNKNLIFPIINTLEPAVSNTLLINSETSPIAGYLDGFGNLAVYHPLEYRIYAQVRSDGWTQAKIIASKAEKLK